MNNFTQVEFKKRSGHSKMQQAIVWDHIRGFSPSCWETLVYNTKGFFDAVPMTNVIPNPDDSVCSSTLKETIVAGSRAFLKDYVKKFQAKPAGQRELSPSLKDKEEERSHEDEEQQKARKEKKEKKKESLEKKQEKEKKEKKEKKLQEKKETKEKKEYKVKKGDEEEVLEGYNDEEDKDQSKHSRWVDGRNNLGVRPRPRHTFVASNLADDVTGTTPKKKLNLADEATGTPPKKKLCRKRMSNRSKSSDSDSDSDSDLPNRDSDSVSDGDSFFPPTPNKRNLRKAFYAQRAEAAYWKKIANRRHKKSKKAKELKMERARNQLNQHLLNERRFRTLEDIARNGIL